MKITTRKTDLRIYQNLQKDETKVARNQFTKDLVRNTSQMLNEGKNPQPDIVNYNINELLTLNPEIKRAMKEARAGGVAYRLPDIDFQLHYGLIHPDAYNQILDQYEETLRLGTLSGDLSDDEIQYHDLHTTLTQTANALQAYIKETGKHKPLGIDWWVTLTPEKLKKLADMYISHNESENLVFRALKLLTSEFGTSFNINPQVVYSLTGLDKRTGQRAIKRLGKRYQDFKVEYQKKTCQYCVACLPKGKRTGREIQVSIPLEGETCPDKWTVSEKQKQWQMLHEYNTGRPPRYHNDPRAPHLILRNGNIKAKLGTFSLIELFSLYTDYKPNSDFDYAWRAQSIPSRRMNAYPYTVTGDFWENKANCLAMEYLYKVQFPMQDRGLPLDIEQTESLIRRLEGYLEGTRKLPKELLNEYGKKGLNEIENRATIDEKVMNRLRILRKIKKYYDLETERIYPMIIPRATASERAGTRWPNIQNFPKDLRHILRNSREKLVMFDISGQENYIITETRDFESMREINTTSDLATCIHERTGIDRKEVKTIVHALTKGKGLSTFDAEGKGEIASQVASEIQALEPRWGEHRGVRTKYCEEKHGRTEKTKLGQSGLVVDRRRADCQAVAIADQMQGAEQKKLWLIKLQERLPEGHYIGIDMHDAAGIIMSTDADAKETQDTVEQTLNEANAELGYIGMAKLASKEYKDIITRKAYCRGGRAYRYTEQLRIKRKSADSNITSAKREDNQPLKRNSSYRRQHIHSPIIWVHYSSGQTTSPEVLPVYSPENLFPP